MFKGWRRRRQLAGVREGDGSALPPYRFYHLLTRSLFLDEVVDADGGRHRYAVDVRHAASTLSDIDADGGRGRPQVALYRDGAQTHRSNAPATLPYPGGVIEVASSYYGLKRMHHVSDDGTERVLRPHRSSAEGLRARFDRRFPLTSRLIGAAAIVVLLVGLVLLVPQTAELVTSIDPVAERVGTFTSPIQLGSWFNGALLGAGILAATERALMLRNHWLIDLDTTWTAFS